MNKFFKNFTKDQKYINLHFHKKLISFDKQLNKFTIKDIYVKDYVKVGKNLLLYPYPCIIK
jgi:hypothetical protein